jgi:hypothetical protein
MDMPNAPRKPPVTASWSGELLWPQDLEDGDVIDLSGVQALGSWVLAWFRTHPGRAVTRASPAIRRQLVRSGVTVVWVDPTPSSQSGVLAAERAMLLGGES